MKDEFDLFYIIVWNMSLLDAMFKWINNTYINFILCFFTITHFHRFLHHFFSILKKHSQWCYTCIYRTRRVQLGYLKCFYELFNFLRLNATIIFRFSFLVFASFICNVCIIVINHGRKDVAFQAMKISLFTYLIADRQLTPLCNKRRMAMIILARNILKLQQNVRYILRSTIIN